MKCSQDGYCPSEVDIEVFRMIAIGLQIKIMWYCRRSREKSRISRGSGDDCYAEHHHFN